MTRPPARGDVERYEQLRGQALAGAPGGSRLGLALLQHRGVTAWTRAWHSTTARTARLCSARRAGRRAGDRQRAGDDGTGVRRGGVTSND